MKQATRLGAAALAASAALAGAAQAQQANPVTLYGRAYATVESVSASGGTSPVSSRTRVESRNSLIGFRGTEDLGGGLKAFFQVESLVAVDAGTGNFATRNSGVGLQGSWGSLVIGRWDTPFKLANTGVDPFQDLALSDMTAASLNQNNNFSRRENNTIQYWSPKFANFEVRLHYSANEGKTATVNPRLYSASIKYEAGPLSLALATEQHSDQNGTTAVAGNKETGNSVAGTYKVGNVKLSGHYGKYKETGTVTQKSYAIGVDWREGNHQVVAQYQNSKNGGLTSAAAQPECDVKGVGYRYHFSRRTFFMAEVSRVTNKVGNLCNFGVSPLTIAADQDPRGVSAGLRHTF